MKRKVNKIRGKRIRTKRKAKRVVDYLSHIINLLIKFDLKAVVGGLQVERIIDMPVTRNDRETALKVLYEKKYKTCFGFDLVTTCAVTQRDIRFTIKNHRIITEAYAGGRWRLVKDECCESIYNHYKRRSTKQLIHDKNKLN